MDTKKYDVIVLGSRPGGEGASIIPKVKKKFLIN